MRVIDALPPDLTKLLFELGPRKLVLVEGQSDRMVFREWYRDRLSEVEFFTPEVPQGESGVQKLLARVLALSTSPRPREFGIIDRDFRSDAEVEAPHNDPYGHLFVLRRYSIENYLLEPAVPAEEIRVLTGDERTGDEMQNVLLHLCQDFCAMMSANWVFVEGRAGKHFAEAHDLIDRATVVSYTAKQLSCSESEAEEQIAAKEALISPLLTDLDSAYTRINGKHLLFRVHKDFTKTGVNKEQFRSLLARAIRQRAVLHSDIQAIMEQRILV